MFIGGRLVTCHLLPVRWQAELLAALRQESRVRQSLPANPWPLHSTATRKQSASVSPCKSMASPQHRHKKAECVSLSLQIHGLSTAPPPESRVRQSLPANSWPLHSTDTRKQSASVSPCKFMASPQHRHKKAECVSLSLQIHSLSTASRMHCLLVKAGVIACREVPNTGSTRSKGSTSRC